MTITVTEINNRSLKFAVLEVLASANHAHRFTLLGRGQDKGALEHQLGVKFEPSERQLADFAFQELMSAGLIRSTYRDSVDPGSWVEITDEGRRALGRRQLDDLDEALGAIGPALVEFRDGAWAAVTSRRPDSLRQASHSARELIDQVLKEGAPDELVRQMAGFQEDSSSRSGITRRHRMRFLMLKSRGSVSDSDLAVVEKACDLVLAADDRLKALAHSRAAPSVSEVRDSLLAAEIALRRVLLPDDAA